MGETRMSRRAALQFLAGLGVTTASPALLAAIDASLNAAKAQAAPGSVVPPLGVYLPNWPDMVELWRQLSRDWAALGVELDLQQGTLDTFISQIVAEHKMPHLGSMSWGGAPDRLDPDFFLSEMFTTRRNVKGGMNFGHYRNTKYDELADKQRAEMDVEARKKLVHQAQAIVADELPSIVLFHRDIIHAYNKRRFKGVKPILGNGIGFPYMPLAYLDLEALTPRKQMRLTTIYDIASLNPFFSAEIYNSTTMRQMYATWVTRDENAEVAPWAAERWTSVNPTTMDIVLRQGMKFHDGRPCTIEDAKFSFDFVLKHKFPALSRVADAIESTEITGTNTLRLKLKSASASFVPNVLGFAFLAPKHIWENLPANADKPQDFPNDKPVGSGPWKLVEWKKSEYLHFAANKDFFKPPKLDALVVMAVPQMESMVGMLERGDSDMLGWNLDMTLGERIAKNPELEVVRTPTHGMHELRLNLGLPPLDKLPFRRALSHATDRKKLLDVIFSGAGVVSNGAPMTPALKSWANPDLKTPEASVDKARGILRDAGYTWNAQGKLQFPA